MTEYETGHGGDVYSAAEALKKIPANRIMDFSASINPLGPSKKVKAEIRKSLKNLGTYPDPACRRLCKRIGQIYNIDPSSIICGNGSNELIYLMVSALKPKTVLVSAPSFSEYSRAAKIAGADVKKINLEEKNSFRIDPNLFAQSMEGCDMAFLGNPNNPTGHVLSKDQVLFITDKAAATGCILVVDEAFIDFCPEESVITANTLNSYENSYKNLVVLRSLTKFHALAGLRIGFGVFPKNLIPTLKAAKDPWSVNSLAQRAAYVALGDKVFVKETIQWLKQEKTLLESELSKMGFTVIPSDVNFLFLRHPEAKALRNRLYTRGLLLRDCSNFDGLNDSYLRIAVRSRKENSRLIKELRFCINSFLKAKNVS